MDESHVDARYKLGIVTKSTKDFITAQKYFPDDQTMLIDGLPFKRFRVGNQVVICDSINYYIHCEIVEETETHIKLKKNDNEKSATTGSLCYLHCE